MKHFLQHYYHRFILHRPRLTLLIAFAALVFFGFHVPQFTLDASSDTLVLEHDPVLKYYRTIKERYGSDDYLIVTYSPEDDLFNKKNLQNIESLSQKIESVEHVASVMNILNAPLIQSPPISLSDLSSGVVTIANGKADIDLARKELTSSPLYKNLLISNDQAMTALLVSFKPDQVRRDLLAKRNELLLQQKQVALTERQNNELDDLRMQLRRHNQKTLNQQQNDIASIRQMMEPYTKDAVLHLGGVPMITVDSIDFISKDLQIFGIAVACFVVLLLWIIFGYMRWILLPLITCCSVGVMMFGLLGFIHWPVTVVSSNFISLLLIITLSMTVHLIVRYKELCAENASAGHEALVQKMVAKMASPCFFTTVTTMVAFGSLVISGIRPVIDFGWMMMMGVAISFIVVFTIFPALLMLLPASNEAKLANVTDKITHFFSALIQKHGYFTLAVFAMLGVLSVMGMMQLSVENRFIDYYKKSTEIYQGMEAIDTKLGGTTPMEIIIDAPQEWLNDTKSQTDSAENGLKISRGYWFNGFMLEDIEQIHRYLDGLEETGKVLSFDTAIAMLKMVDKKSEIDNFYLSVLYKKLPEQIKNVLFSPYISEDGNQLRFSTRVFESDPSLNRKALLAKIKDHLIHDLGYQEDQVHITGMLVLYNNMLQSLFTSQILTIGFVFIAIFGMFILSFRNVYVAILAIFPNMIAAAMVLGLMGWLGIPLDIMTITIAAICIGIAVDDTIHYVHRFAAEFEKDGDYWGAVRRSHETIGRAMYYTSLTITLGFSILVFSNFVPTVYFGLLTAFSMVVALLADLTLLPLLIVLCKPFKKLSD